MRVLSAILFMCALGCGGAGGGKVDQAVAIAKELRAKPDDAERILGAHNMTAEQWEALMFEIASDPKLAEGFEEGLKP